MAGRSLIASWSKPTGARLRLYSDGRLVGSVRGRSVSIRHRPVELPSWWTEAMADDYARCHGFERDTDRPQARSS